MEVPLVGSDATRWTTVSIPAPRIPPASECSCPPTRNAAGAVLVPSASNKTRDSFIIWRLHQATPTVMELVQFSSQQDFPSHGLRLSFDESLCPFADIVPIEVNNGQGLHFSVTIVTTSAIVYVLKLPVSSDLWNSFTVSTSSVMLRDLSNDFSRLQSVTAFTAAGNILFVGGQSGSVLCFSLFADPNNTQDLCYELKGGDAGIGRLWGLVSRNKIIASVKSLIVQEIQNKPILFVLHEDGSLQAWDPLHHVRLLSHNICPSPELTGCIAISMWMEDGVFAASKQLAVLFGKASENSRSTICIYSVDPTPSSGFQLGVPILQQAVPIDQGTVLDVKLLQGSLWLLKHAATNDYNLIHLKLQLGVLPQQYHMREEEIHEQLLYPASSSENEVLPFLMNQSPLGGASCSELFIRRFLQPRVFHHETMQGILRARGASISDSSLRMMSEDDWRREISSATSSDVVTEDAAKLKIWTDFSADYISVWKQNHAPYALLSDVATGCVGVVRKCSLSLVRTQSSVERAASSNPLPFLDGKEQLLNGLLSCMREVISHIGKFPLALFDESLMQRKGSSIDQLVSLYVRNLDIGCQSRQELLNLGLDDFREKEKQRHLKQRKFNFRISQALRQIRNGAGSWDTILDSVAAYERSLLFGSIQKLFRIPSMGNAFTKLIVQATSQVLWAHFEEARNLVLFLSFIINLKSQVGLTASETARIHLHILPRVKKAMMINLMLHWLTITPGESPYSDDFNSLLSSLKIDASNGTTAWKTNVGFGELTLADVLASSFLEAAPITFRQHNGAFVEKGDLLDYTRGFITWLSLGQDNTLNFSRRVIALSTILLQHGQYRGLENFLGIIEKLSSEQTYLEDVFDAHGESSARLHLFGFCLLARACSGTKGPLNSENIEEASSCFFRAAAGLGDSEDIFQSLFKRTGAGQIDPTAEASWKLHYFEWVMQIFEQHNLREGATQFALAALDEVDKAVNSNDNLRTKGRLWANVFKFAMDLDMYGEAYSAIISNPDEEVKLTCLRRFVVVLCERKAIQALCGGDLPYAGFLDAVEQELSWKAEYSDISAKPSVYKLLYAFHLHRHNYRRAACYMYRYAMRMRDEGVSKSRIQVAVALQEQVNGLAAAINALNLVSSSFAWIDKQFTGSGELSGSSPSKRLRLTEQKGVSKPIDEEEYVVDVEALDKEYVVAVAKLELVNANIKHPMIGELSPPEVIRLLVQAALYDCAFATVFRLWKDSRLKRELEKIFELISRNCCLQQSTSLTIRPSSDKQLTLPGLEIADDLPGPAKSGWHALQMNLEKYRAVHPRLPVVAAETILSANKNMELPLWLVDMLRGGKTASPFGMAAQEGDPAALLRIYIDNGRLVEASFLVLDFLRAWANMRPSDVIKRKRMSAAWFPYTLIDRLQQLLAEHSERDPRCGELRSSLQAALQRHTSQMKADSDDVASLVQNQV